MPPSDYMSVKTAALYLGLNEKTLYQMLKAGKITHYRIGPGKGAIRFKPGDLDNFVESRRVPAKPSGEAAVQVVAAPRPARTREHMVKKPAKVRA
jgi:excisionase family DNA binding protein